MNNSNNKVFDSYNIKLAKKLKKLKNQKIFKSKK